MLYDAQTSERGENRLGYRRLNKGFNAKLHSDLEALRFAGTYKTLRHITTPMAAQVHMEEAGDAIVLGPGSLYTSILPNLLVDRIAQAVARAHAPKIYVCNVMTQPGETDDYTASRHVAELLRHAHARVCDYTIVNLEPPQRLLETYAEGGQVPVEPDREQLAGEDDQTRADGGQRNNQPGERDLRDQVGAADQRVATAGDGVGKERPG